MENNKYECDGCNQMFVAGAEKNGGRPLNCWNRVMIVCDECFELMQPIQSPVDKIKKAVEAVLKANQN